MHVTELIASKKLCPFMTYCVNSDQASYQNFAIKAQEFCQGSNCMAWVWDNQPQRKFILGGPERPSTVPENWLFCPEEDDPSCWVEPESECQSRRTGYCGRVYGS